MIELEQIFFEMSNRDRLSILELLSKNSLTLTEIGNQLQLNPSETSRHLNRLTVNHLVEKTIIGDYAISSFGELVLIFLPGFRYITENSAYWMTHSFELIPNHLLIRIGILDDVKFIDDVMISLYESEKLVKEAKKNVNFITDQVLMNILPLLPDMSKKGIEFNVIFPESAIPHEDFYTSDEQNVNNRFLAKLPLFLGFNESKALIGFNYKDGRIDHRLFIVSGDEGIKWCKELFSYFWEKASTELPDHLRKYDY